VAERIVALARSSGVPVYRDEKLAQALNQLRVGDAIPQALYEVVAEVLVFVAGVDRDYKGVRKR